MTLGRKGTAPHAYYPFNEVKTKSFPYTLHGRRSLVSLSKCLYRTTPGPNPDTDGRKEVVYGPEVA